MKSRQSIRQVFVSVLVLALMLCSFQTIGFAALEDSIEEEISLGEEISGVLKDPDTVTLDEAADESEEAVSGGAEAVAAIGMAAAGMPDITEVQLTDIQTSRYHTLALDSEGNVWAWGYNGSGQWGVGFTGNAPAYKHVLVQGLPDVVQIAVGGGSSYALQADGTVWSWGDNNYGQLGNGTTRNSSVPVQVIGLDNVQQIAAGYTHCLALKEDGTVWAWGSGSQGQLGNRNTSNQSKPVQAINLDNVIAISAGERHSMALKQDGTLWAWGNNDYGQTGTTNTSTPSPMQPSPVQRLLNMEQIEAGYRHNIALKEDGTIWAWGDDGTALRRAPIQLTITDVQRVFAGGGRHTFIQQEDGTVWTWGSNESGQLGLGDQTDRSEPTQMSDPPMGILTTGYSTSIYVRADGSIWGCGDNSNGQLRMDESKKTIITPIELFGPGTYTGGGTGPIDPTDPEEHTVTVIQRYADGTADLTNTYRVENGQPFSETYESTGTIQNFEVSAADAGVQADFAARTLKIDAVTRDITITLTFAQGGVVVPPGDHTITITETWSDGSQADRTTTEYVDNGIGFYKVFSIPAGYTAAMTHNSGMQVNYNTTVGAIHIATVTESVDITVTYTPSSPVPASTEASDETSTGPADTDLALPPDRDEDEVKAKLEADPEPEDKSESDDGEDAEKKE